MAGKVLGAAPTDGVRGLAVTSSVWQRKEGGGTPNTRLITVSSSLYLSRPGELNKGDSMYHPKPINLTHTSLKRRDAKGGFWAYLGRMNHCLGVLRSQYNRKMLAGEPWSRGEGSGWT